MEFGTDSKSLSVGVDADSLSAGSPTNTLMDSSSGDYGPCLRWGEQSRADLWLAARLGEKWRDWQGLFVPIVYVNNNVSHMEPYTTFRLLVLRQFSVLRAAPRCALCF